MKPFCRRRIVFVAAVALLWTMALAVALEFAFRAYERVTRVNREAYVSACKDAAMRVQERQAAATADRASQPPPGLSPSPDAPSRYGFFGLRSEEERRAFAIARDELVVIANRDAKVGAVYAPLRPLELIWLSGRLAPDVSLHSVFAFDDVIREDAETAFRQAASGQSQIRDYPMRVEKNAVYLTSVTFEPCRAPDGGVESVAVFFQPSIFEALWFKYRPHMWRSENFIGWTVWTNNVGFRDDEIALPKPAAVFRIVCIGGSTTFEGPRCDLTYPNLLEQRLRTYCGTTNVEAVNCGVFGLDSAAEVRRLDDFFALEPDLLVHYNFANDANQVISSAFMALESSTRPGDRFRRWLRRSHFVRGVCGRLAAPSGDMLLEAMTPYTLENLRKMVRAARDRGVPMAICSFARPDFEHLSWKDLNYYRQIYDDRLGVDIWTYARAVDVYNAAVRRLCEEEGILYIPVAEHVTGGPDRFTDHCHLYLNGIELKAHAVFDAVKDVVRAAAKQKSAS